MTDLISGGGFHGSDQWKTMSLSTLKDDTNKRPPRSARHAPRVVKQGLVVGGMNQHQWATMSLSTIKPRHDTRLFKEPKKSNQTSDIPGASVPKAYKFTNKPDYGCRVDDIEGARPMKLERTSNAISRITDCSDIDGAQPMPHGFKTIRFTDPLNPTYNLSVVKPEPAPALRFLGDRNNPGDIAGARPAALYKWQQRKTMNLNDIEGAQAGWKPKHKRHNGPPRDNINVLDIIGGQWKSKRVTDPLNPVHIIHGLVIEDDKRSRPRELPKKRNGPNLMLTRDIPGAYPGWVPPDQRKVRQVRPTNQTNDITGAQADSYKHGIRTKRISNPLDPFYTGVDGSQLGSIKKPNTPPAAQSSFFRDIDADGDGNVSAKELMAKLDQDGDGVVSSKEMGNFGTAARPPMPAVERLNLSTGSAETKEEAISRLEAEIERLRATVPAKLSARSSQRSARQSNRERSSQRTARNSKGSSSKRQEKTPRSSRLSQRETPRSSRLSQRDRPLTQSQKRERAQIAADKAMVASLGTTTSTPAPSSSRLQEAGKHAVGK